MSENTRELEDRIEQLDEIENDADRVGEFIEDARNRFADISGYQLEGAYGAYNDAEEAIEQVADAIADLLIAIHEEQAVAQDELDEDTENEEDDDDD